MAYCYYSYGRRYCRNSRWNNWGRWVLLGIIILFAFLLFFGLRAGQRPFYGTGWAATGQNNYGNNPGYQQQQSQYQQPPYGQNHQPQPDPNQGGYYGQNQSYFGGQQTGVEMQAPSNTYRAGDNVYQPPTGPPPGKA